MSAIIIGTGVCLDETLNSSVAQSTAAARDAIEKAGIELEDIGLFINCGLYRDENICEPAMAALIQKELGLCLDFIKAGTTKTTISFDLMNGEGGTINAIQLAASFLDTGSVQNALIVSGDGHPAKENGKDFPYAASAAAMVLTQSPDSSRGFQRFLSAMDDHQSPGLTGRCDFSVGGSDGRNSISIEKEAGYEQRCLEFASTICRKMMDADSTTAKETVLITSQPHPQFTKDMASKSDMPHFLEQKGLNGTACTSGIMIGCHQILSEPEQDSCKQLLLVGVSSGISVNCATYAL